MSREQTFNRRAANRNSRNNSGCAVFVVALVPSLIAALSIAAGFAYGALS